MSPGDLGLLLAGTGLVLLWLAVRQLRRRRALAGGATTLVSLALLAGGGLLLGLAASFEVYDRLSREQAVGTLEFVALGSQSYEARLTLADDTPTRYFNLRGDEWQLDVRFVKWTGIGSLLGLDGFYQLDRLSGRYRDAADQRSRELTAFGLSPATGDAMWRAVSSLERWAPLIDAVYGSATYLPMADDARYEVAVTRSGLLARPANDAAVAAVDDW